MCCVNIFFFASPTHLTPPNLSIPTSLVGSCCDTLSASMAALELCSFSCFTVANNFSIVVSRMFSSRQTSVKRALKLINLISMVKHPPDTRGSGV